MNWRCGIRAFTDDVSLYKKVGFKRLILSAGMMRSGSTLLFNILRLALSYDSRNLLSSGWIMDLSSLPSGRLYLVKTHRLSAMAVARASHTYYTYRDVRDALVSYSKKFGQPSFEVAASWVREFQSAKRYATRMISYDELVENLENTVANLLLDLEVNAPPQEIIGGIPASFQENEGGERYSKTTLLHSGHRTYTHAGEWREQLDPELIDRLHSDLGWWFVENGYPVS